MSLKKLTVFIGSALVAIQGLVPPSAYAVGPGVNFGFRETPIPGTQMHALFANSLDFTYHDCLDFTDPDSFDERGYLWISSFQDVAGVVDSQINHFLPNGYHLYAIYRYQADECDSQATCTANKTRRNYTINTAGIQIFADPLQDTVLALNGCAVAVANNADDLPIGAAAQIEEGQKTETNDLINGDFEIVFSNWAFSAFGQALFRDLNGNPLVAPTLVVNGNVTQLLGPLNNDHRPEGSGNLYWLVD